MPIDYSKFGYRIDLENKANLIAQASPMPQITFAAPEEIDPRDWHRIENQGAMGSCQGHALSSVVEYTYHIATGEVIQLSPMWCYLETQKIDGLIGRDCGSTIDGGRQCAEQKGVCELPVFPYPNPVHYTTQEPSDAATNALKYRTKSHVYCRSYDDVLQFLESGAGGVEIGISWNNSMTPNSQGRIEQYRSGGGGHALCFLGYSKDVTDTDGRKYLWLANSWSDQWDAVLKGWALVSPRAVSQMCADQSVVMIGISDMDIPNQRKFNWDKSSIFHPYSKT